jgi:hypothetical protein
MLGMLLMNYKSRLIHDFSIPRDDMDRGIIPRMILWKRSCIRHFIILVLPINCFYDINGNICYEGIFET